MILNIKKLTRGAHLLQAVFRKYRWKFIGMAVLGFLAGLSGSIGIGAVIPLFGLLTNQGNESTNFITDAIGKFFEILHLPFTPSYLIFFIVLLFIVKALVQFSAKYFNERTAAEFEEELRTDLYRHTMETRWLYLMNQKVGYLERILLFDVQQSASIIVQMNASLLIVTSLITYTFVALNISVLITMITLGLGVILFFFFKPLFYRTRKLATLIGDTYRESSHHVSEHVIGAKTAKASGVERSLLDQAKIYFRNLRNARTKTAIYSNVTGSFIEPIGFLLIAVIFLMTYRNPTFDIVAFAVVVYLIQKMFAFIQSLQGQLHGLSELVPYFETTVRYRNEVIREREETRGSKQFAYEKELAFRGVSFAYPGRDMTLSNVNFTVNRGTSVAITGPSGMGKTTLADLILRLLEPKTGTITLDGVPISDISISEWRKRVAYVPQEIFLLNDTVEKNIRYFDVSLTQTDIEEAAKMANIYNMIMELPQKFKTQVGERGLHLSGGQRQRIALARALIRKPDILILDEPTSALDEESENMILEALRKHRGEITIITIAHGIGFLDIVDQRLVVDEGNVLSHE